MMMSIVNPELFWGGEVRLTDDVYDPNTQEVRWAKDKRLTWRDVIDMLELGIVDIPVHHNGLVVR